MGEGAKVRKTKKNVDVEFITITKKTGISIIESAQTAAEW